MASIKDRIVTAADQVTSRNGQHTNGRAKTKTVWTCSKRCAKCGGAECLIFGGYHACRNVAAETSLGETRHTMSGTFHIHMPYCPSAREPTPPGPELPGEIPELRLDVVCIADVIAKVVEWLWGGRIPLGMISLLCGQPGVGKSTFCRFLIACITKALMWPDGSGRCPSGEAIVLSSEESLEYTIRPGLDAAGADVSKVFFVRGTAEVDLKTGQRFERAVRLDLDLRQIEALLQLHPNVKLVVVDPISEYLGKIDSHKNADVRAVISPLAALAEKYHVAIVLVTHFNKGSGQALYKAMGSLAFVAAARAAWAFVPDAEDQDRVLFLPLKMNIAKRPPGLAYKIVDARIEWEDGDVETSADEALLAAAQPSKGDKLAEAMAWLKTRLADGSEVESEILTTEAKKAGITFATYRRAKSELGVRNRKGRISEGGKFFVSLQEEHVTPHAHDEPLEQVEQHTDQDAQQAQHTQEDHVVHVVQGSGEDWTGILDRAEQEAH